jgi:excisionase family DNA binding protein
VGLTRLLTVRGVGRRLAVSRRVVYGLLRRRALAGVRVGRAWRIDPSALEAFVAAQTQPADVPEAAGVDDRQLALFEEPPRLGLAPDEEVRP